MNESVTARSLNGVPFVKNCDLHGETEFSSPDPVLLRRECLRCRAEKMDAKGTGLTRISSESAPAPIRRLA